MGKSVVIVVDLWWFHVEVTQRNQVETLDFLINWKNQIPEDNVNMGHCFTFAC